VARELEMIGKHAGFDVGAVFPYKIDYSQFVPRGHYTRSEDLKKFFRAMMIYGLSPFASSDDTPLVQGLLWTRALYSKGLDKDWERIYEPTTFFVGRADDLRPDEYRDISARVYGASAGIEGFGDDAKLATLKDELKAARAASINPEFRVSDGASGSPRRDGQSRGRYRAGRSFVHGPALRARLGGDAEVVQARSSARSRAGWT
jgi:hypothetical protein